MVVVPPETPVTTPVLDTVAIAVDEEVQGVVGCAVPEPVRVDVELIVVLKVPDIVGSAFTVKVAVCEQPLLFL
jgi:hypothetical protein